jgi:hypothetical protein
MYVHHCFIFERSLSVENIPTQIVEKNIGREGKRETEGKAQRGDDQ